MGGHYGYIFGEEIPYELIQDFFDARNHVLRLDFVKGWEFEFREQRIVVRYSGGRNLRGHTASTTSHRTEGLGAFGGVKLIPERCGR